MSGVSSGVSYLTLAYLIEIAVVLNLAYRELKFPELNNKLHEKVGEILSKAQQREIPRGTETYKEHDELARLISRNGDDDQAFWGSKPISHWFFNKFIRTRRSLYVVNINIVSSIVILIGCTIATGYYPPFESVFLVDNTQKQVWVLLLIVLTIMTVLPLVFIRMATLCETHLLGVDNMDNMNGLVKKLANRMFKTKDEEDKKAAESAKKFSVPTKSKKNN